MTVRMYKTVAVYELYVSFDSRLVNVYKSTGVHTRYVKAALTTIL